MSGSGLVVEGLAKAFGSFTALRDVTFSVAAGSTFGLLGPNGAGKTTTMRLVLGILAPDRGTVRWDGRDVGAQARRFFGYLPEERGLYAKVPVREQIVYFGRLHGLDAREAGRRAGAMLERLGLAAHASRPAGELSKGNQQKVQLACAVVHEPPLLVLDEPFSGLDIPNAEIVLGLLRDIQSRGTTLILSSHQLWQLEDLCDAFCIIAGGATRLHGTLAELRAGWGTRVLAVAPDGPALRTVLDQSHYDALPAPAGTLRYRIPATTDRAALLRRLVAAGDVVAFECLEPPLAEIYLDATQAPG